MKKTKKTRAPLTKEAPPGEPAGPDAPQPGTEPEAAGAQLLTEEQRDAQRMLFIRTLRSTVAVLVVATAIAVLIATQIIPVFRIYGDSMSPTLKRSDIVVSVRTKQFKTGDIIAFYYNNQVLIKRVIAGPGQVVDIDRVGTVRVDGEEIDEPYLRETAKGECTIELPYQVPESHFFVMGDNREVSLDSRNEDIGCVDKSHVVGRLLFCIWPLKHMGGI